MSQEEQDNVEKKGAILGIGETQWVKPNMRLFTKTFRLKAVDWLNLSRGAGLHIFNGHIGGGLSDADKRKQVEGWEAILQIFNMCCNVTCNVDGAKHTPAEALRSDTTPTIQSYTSIVRTTTHLNTTITRNHPLRS